MAYFSIRPSLISCLVLMFLLFAGSSYALKVVDVSVICKRAKNLSFCSNLLNSKPGGAAGADLVSLAHYTIDVARGNATNTINLIKSLIAQSGKDPKAKAHYQNCLSHFNKKNGALGAIEFSQERLKLGDYQGVKNAFSVFLNDVDECISGDHYPDKSKLPQYVDFIDQVVDIILTISDFLQLK